MKIAVLFSGRIEKYKEHYKYFLENICKDNEVDFYLSTATDIVNFDELIKFNDLYKPIKISYEHIKPIADEFIKNNNINPRVYNTYCMHYNRNKVFQLLESTNINYDIFITTRLDYLINDEINYNELNNDDIYIPEGADWAGLNDQFAITKKLSVMKIYMSVIDNIKEFINLRSKYADIPDTKLIPENPVFPRSPRCLSLPPILNWDPELLCKWQLHFNNVKVIRFNNNSQLCK